MAGNCGDGQRRDGDRAHDHQQNRDHHGHDGPVNEEFGHDALPPLPLASANGCGFTGMPGPNLLHSFGYDALARLQTFVDDPHCADAIAHLDGPDADLVLCVDDGNLIGALQFGDCALRNQQAPGVFRSMRGRGRIVPGAEYFRDWETIRRAGSRRWSDSPAGRRRRISRGAHRQCRQPESARAAIVRSPRSVGLCWEPPVEVEILLLAHREVDLDGIER